jgi:hypothetical protein
VIHSAAVWLIQWPMRLFFIDFSMEKLLNQAAWFQLTMKRNPFQKMDSGLQVTTERRCLYESPTVWHIVFP